jgi:SAM-dependent methyltransferase
MIKPLKILCTRDFKQLQYGIFSSFLKSHFARLPSKIYILEAGCGKKWNFDLAGIDHVLIGLDISKEALEIRKYKQQDLDEIIVGDLRTVELQEGYFDVIYSSYVLEHIEGAEKVLDKFFKWLKPNGFLILVIPDRNTVFGLGTRLTPHSFHILFYKHVLKSPHAGKPGWGPFPTWYDSVVSMEGIRKYCRVHGFKIHREVACKPDSRRLFGLLDSFIRFLAVLVEGLSLRRISSKYSSLLYVIEKGGS